MKFDKGATHVTKEADDWLTYNAYKFENLMIGRGITASKDKKLERKLIKV